MSDIITSDRPFSPSQVELLTVLADLMIPAGDGLPSASDPAIFHPALETLSTLESSVAQGLAALAELISKRNVESLTTLDDAERSELIENFKVAAPGFVQVFQGAIITSYYRDDRVLEALGLPARSPHPGGYDAPATDWSLLDPVRSRAPFYRTS